jgi:hypothetical protein
LGRPLFIPPRKRSAILELFEEEERHPQHAHRLGQIAGGRGGAFQGPGPGQRSIYTCPIKALVNEKWLALCREFGPENVGLSTGDASVNRDAPILCCTAEILANIALREGAEADVRKSSWTSSITTPTASGAWPGRFRC